MRGAISTVVIFFAAGLASGSAQSWRIGDDQPFRTKLTDLPTMLQKSILKSIEPSLMGRAEESDLDPEELAAAEKALLVREISTRGGHLTLVQGSDSNLCGGTGNCKVWVLGKRNHILLDGQAYRLTILRTINKGLPSIVTSSSWTSQGSAFIRYSFDGSRYRPQSCAFEQMTDYRGKVYAKPRLEYVSCRLVEVVRPIQSRHP
jgi:hypothetical protein